ncbi:hypothetical protein IAT40_000994 [Kwoniella sp. CBS 6097]
MVRTMLSTGLAIVAYPFFILLHLTFIVSSIILRTYQALTATSSILESESESESGTTKEDSTTASVNRPPPKHIGLVLVPLARTRTRTRTRTSRSKSEMQARRRNEVDALRQSVLRTVEWAQKRGGVEEISVWDGQGLTQSAMPELIHALTSSSHGLPPSPPDSSPSTPPLRPTQDDENPDHSPDTPAITLSPPSESSLSSQSGSNISFALKQGKRQFGRGDSDGQGLGLGRVTSITVQQRCKCDLSAAAAVVVVPMHGAALHCTATYGDPSQTLVVGPSSPKSPSNQLTIHFLPPSGSSALLTDLTRTYASTKTPLSEIEVKKVDEDIREQMRFKNDPDIILIHQLCPPGFWSRILPRKAPELWGYPFWNLRITEVYQYPTPIPFPSPLRTLIQILRSSSLPSLRKLGYSVSLPASLHYDQTGATVLDRIEWEGALDAWGKVEQRLGR